MLWTISVFCPIRIWDGPYMDGMDSRPSLFYGMERNRAERNHGLNHGMEWYLKIKAYHCWNYVSFYLLATSSHWIYYKKRKRNVGSIVGLVVISNEILIVRLISLSDFHLLVYQTGHFNSLHNRGKIFYWLNLVVSTDIDKNTNHLISKIISTKKSNFCWYFTVLAETMLLYTIYQEQFRRKQPNLYWKSSYVEQLLPFGLSSLYSGTSLIWYLPLSVS